MDSAIGITALTDDNPGSGLTVNGTVAMLNVTVTGLTVSVMVIVDAPPPSPHIDSVLRGCSSDCYL